MSFRCLRDFNIALLGKQAWRLSCYPDKLVSRIFKARYYPTSTFLTATLGSNPSYIWRSVMKAQSLIKNGISCRIGDGREVDILNTHWLPSISDPYVHTVNEALNNQKVFSLLKTGERAWDEDLVCDQFNSKDAEIILSIRLGTQDNDAWYWRR